MKKQMLTVVAVAIAAMAWAQGGVDPAVVRRNVMIEQTHAEVQRLGEQFNLLSESQEKLAARVDGLGGDNGVADLRAQIEGLRAENASLKRQMSTMREEIVNEIVKKIAAMNLGGASRSAAPAPTPRVATPARPATPVEPSGKYFEYVVEAGDSLSGIARKYNENGYKTSLQAILNANPGFKPEKMRVGQKIYVPIQDAPKKR